MPTINVLEKVKVFQVKKLHFLYVKKKMLYILHRHVLIMQYLFLFSH